MNQQVKIWGAIAGLSLFSGVMGAAVYKEMAKDEAKANEVVTPDAVWHDTRCAKGMQPCPVDDGRCVFNPAEDCT